MPEITELLEKMQVLGLKKDDILVLSFKNRYPMGYYREMKRYFEEDLKITNRLIVLEEGAEVGIIRKGDEK